MPHATPLQWRKPADDQLLAPWEKEKNKDKVYGFTEEERKADFSEAHEGQDVQQRVDENKMKKTDWAIEMLKHANKRGIHFNFMLVDSWFTPKSVMRTCTVFVYR